MTAYLQQRTLFPPQIPQRPSLNLGLVVVIPAYDEPFLLLSLLNLQKCVLPTWDVEVIVVVNESEKAAAEIRQRNTQIAAQAKNWALKNSRPRLRFHILHHTLPAKHAGVGLARKIGMDEACWRLERARNPEGVIACFDADSRCDENYLQALEKHFRDRPAVQACSIYFEHPLQGADFEQAVYEAITLYELHLRYYVEVQRYAGFPHAHHTIGSSMAVRSSAYQAQGGMNKRKAGEDFYFIHKFTLLPGFSELQDTRVIPSARPSHRVPFGTGRAVQEILRQKGRHLTYAPQSFEDLRRLLKQLPDLYQASGQWEAGVAPSLLSAFLAEQSFEERWKEFLANTSSYTTFRDRFFRWFNAFMVMKYVHFARDKGQEDIPVMEAARWLLEKRGTCPETSDAQGLLLTYRRLQRHDQPG